MRHGAAACADAVTVAFQRLCHRGRRPRSSSSSGQRHGRLILSTTSLTLFEVVLSMIVLQPKSCTVLSKKWLPELQQSGEQLTTPNSIYTSFKAAIFLSFCAAGCLPFSVVPASLQASWLCLESPNFFFLLSFDACRRRFACCD
jgi:hypothetical protein